MRHSRRRAAAGAAALAVLTLLAGCATVVSGNPTIAGSHTSALPSSSATPAVTAGGTATVAPSSDLTTRLAPEPSGSRPWDTEWSKTGAPTVEQFVAHVYPASAATAATAQLRAQGLRAIAHRAWITPDANQADDVLLRFDTATGAQSRYLSATAAKGADSGQLHFAIPGHPEAIGYYDPKLDDLGNVRAIVYGQSGDIVMEVFFFSPAKLDTAAAIAAATRQLLLLPS